MFSLIDNKVVGLVGLRLPGFYVVGRYATQLSQSMGRSRGGLTSKIHAVVDSNGPPIRLALSPGEAHDVRLAGKPVSRFIVAKSALPTGGRAFIALHTEA